MNKHFKIISFVLCAALTLCACGDAGDINQKRIVTAVIMDYKNGEVCFYVEMANIESGNNDTQTANIGKKYIYAKGKGKDILSSRTDLDRNLDREPFLGAIRTVIFTERFANEYLLEYLYRLRSEEKYRKKVMIVTTRDEPEAFLEECHSKDVSVGFSTEETINFLEKNGEAFQQSTERVIEKLSEKYTGILIPSVGMKGGTNTLWGYTVADCCSVKGFIPVNEAMPAVIFHKSNVNYQSAIDYKGQTLSLDITVKDKKITPTYSNGRAKFVINCNVQGDIIYGSAKTPYNFSESDYSAVAKKVEQKLQKDMYDAIMAAQNKFGCDYLQFDDIFRIKYPQKFKDIDWQKTFLQSEISVSVKADVKGIWLMDYSQNKRR